MTSLPSSNNRDIIWGFVTKPGPHQQVIALPMPSRVLAKGLPCIIMHSPVPITRCSSSSAPVVGCSWVFAATGPHYDDDAATVQGSQ